MFRCLHSGHEVGICTTERQPPKPLSGPGSVVCASVSLQRLQNFDHRSFAPFCRILELIPRAHASSSSLRAADSDESSHTTWCGLSAIPAVSRFCGSSHSLSTCVARFSMIVTPAAHQRGCQTLRLQPPWEGARSHATFLCRSSEETFPLPFAIQS